ncbi:hypothetical protein D1632_08605 [Chryseobacterium nematophagum]|uniref:Uncharacterized protein n=1 Tax=Chryseobacterium nematophagum TaxID=2305228 RepID=A0A3M7LDV8_9FLAO|nr:hypothetical protein [Chryseobacterium nematophagum]RMZ59676.1 hypothetical protein D1632_08605 [Chryseobacterium nematophagum]
MAAIRLGFPNLYTSMNDTASSVFKDGLLDDLVVIYFNTDVDAAKKLIGATDIFPKDNIYTIKDLSQN